MVSGDAVIAPRSTEIAVVRSRPEASNAGESVAMVAEAIRYKDLQ